MKSPADTLATLLQAEAGWSIKVGKLVSSPDQVVAFFDTSGETPNPKWTVDYLRVQALVRSGPNDYSAAWAKARAVRDSFLGMESQDIDGDRWVSITCMGDVGFIGYDDKERPTFSVNFRIIMEPASLGNREAL